MVNLDRAVLNFLVRRILQGVVVLFAAYTLSFLILFVLPGDPVEQMLSKGGDIGYVSPETLAELKARYGFEGPIYAQYARSLMLALHGDFGLSFQTGDTVVATIADALPSTLRLVALSFSFAVFLAGVIAIGAWYTSSALLRRLLLLFPPVGSSVPVFWSGFLLLQIFSFGLGWVPAVGDRGFISLILPGVALSIPTAAALAQVLYQSLTSVDEKAYVMVAKAKGNSKARLLRAHIARNAILPTLTVLGLAVGVMLGGSVVTEIVFSRPGLGTLTKNAVTTKDVQVVQAIVLFSAAVYIVINIGVDIAFHLIDPRLAIRKAKP